MVSRIEELRAELTSGRGKESEQSKSALPRRSDDTPREVVRERLTDRERRARMEEKGEIKLGSGEIPDAFWKMPRPEDPEGEVMQALLDERESSR